MTGPKDWSPRQEYPAAALDVGIRRAVENMVALVREGRAEPNPTDSDELAVALAVALRAMGKEVRFVVTETEFGHHLHVESMKPPYGRWIPSDPVIAALPGVVAIHRRRV